MKQETNRRKFLALSLVLTGAGALALAGCGGGKSTFTNGGGAALPQGKAAVRAIALSAHQSISGGRFYAFAAIKLAAPAGSQFTTRAAQGSRAVPDTIVYDAGLQLYKKYASTGSTVSVRYYTDAAATVPAGTATITELGGGDFTNSYPNYPATVNFAADTTEGTVPFTGSGSITYLDASGANTLTGSFTSKRNNVTLAGTLNLTGAGDVTGGMTMTQGGVTTRVTGITGTLSGDLTGSVVSDPYGWTGTIRFSIATGAFTLTLDLGTGTGGGTVSASLDTSGNLVIQFADGTTQTIASPLNEFIGGSGGGTTPTPTPTSTATPTPVPTPTSPPSNAPYQAPISLGNFVSAAHFVIGTNRVMNNAGTLVGSEGGRSFVLPSPYTTKQYLTNPSGYTLLSLQIDDAGEILASTESGDYVYYTSASASPQPFTGGGYPAVLSAGGKVVSANPNGQQINYQTSLGAAPTVLKGGFSPSGISGNGQMVGRGISGSSYTGVYISGPDADPVALSNPFGSNYYDPEPQLISDTGLIVGEINAISGSSKSVIWSSPTAAPTEVPGIGFARSLNNNGQIVGYESATGGWLYQNGAFTKLNDLIPTTSAGVYNMDEALAINDQGWILANGSFQFAGTNTVERHHYILKPR